MSAGRTSEELWAEAQRHLVGGVNSPVRAYRAVGGTPPFIADAEGAVMRSVDGRSYVDFIGSFGPLVLGHSHPAVVEAVQEAAARGTSFAAPHEGEVELARTVKELVPGIEKIRFVNSGTEATQSAIRLARGCTGRDLVLKFEGCYHGHVRRTAGRGGKRPRHLRDRVERRHPGRPPPATRSSCRSTTRRRWTRHSAATAATWRPPSSSPCPRTTACWSSVPSTSNGCAAGAPNTERC